MQMLKKLKEISLALLPILVIVLLVHFTLFKIDTSDLVKFIISLVLIAIGEVLFFTGIDSTIMPMGELMVGAVNKMSRLVVFIVFAIIFGFFATIAEPDVTIFSEQLLSSGLIGSTRALIFCIGAGVGLFIAFATIRIIKNIKLKYIYLGVFAIIFFLCTQVDSSLIAVAFDAGGATTGIITVPFLLAISTGISSKFHKSGEKSNETFGMVGLASLGPIVAVLLYFWIGGGQSSNTTLVENANLFVTTLKNSAYAILPISITFLIYDLLFIKLPTKKKLEFIIGMVITFVGLFMFLYGIELGLSNIGTIIGDVLEKLDNWIVILISFVFGFIITFSEPSVIVLSKKVEKTTKNSISYKVVLISIAISMAISIMLASLKILYNINFFYIVLVGYLIALVLMFFVPQVFTGIAFDSGGVASGPMTSAFVLPIMLSLANASSDISLGFGLVGIVALSPIVVIQILGLIYRINIAVKTSKEHKNAVRVEYSSSVYSNIKNLEEEYNKMISEGKNETES